MRFCTIYSCRASIILRKKTMKNMLESQTGTSVRQVLNLRPYPGGCLRPVGTPLLLPLAHRTPLGGLTVGGVRKLLCAYGSTLCTHPSTASTGVPAVVADTLPAAPDCAVPLSDNRLLVMTAGGYAEVASSGSEVSVIRPPRIEGISLTATDFGPLNETVEGLAMDEKVEDLYARLAAVEGKLIAMGKSAHSRLHQRAAAAGRYCMPVVCGYRLRNLRGEVIFRSQPFLLGNPVNDAAIDLYSTDNKSIKPWEQSVNTWKIHLRARASDDLAAEVGTLEVVALPQMHTVEPSQGGSAVLTRHTSASLPFARLRISEGVGEAYLDSSVAALGARLFTAGKVIHAVGNPFGNGLELDLNCNAEALYSADYAALRKALRTPVGSVPSQLDVRLGIPHAFTATCGCRSGDTVLWGDITPVDYPGYTPEMMAAGFGQEQSWTYSMLTLFSDGRRVYSDGSRTSPLPSKLNALISYPHPAATEIRLRISWSGGVWRRDFTLTPSPCGNFAYHLSPDRAPIPVEANGGAVILSPASSVERLSNVVIAAHASAPTVAVRCIELPDGAVRGIVERPGNDTAWDHTRSRFFIGTRGGVHAIGVYINSDRPTHTLRRLSSCGITHRGAITAAEEGIAALLDVPQGVLPVIISKNGATTRLCEPLSAARICFNPATREILVHGNGLTRVFCGDYGWNWYHRNDISIQDVAQVDGLPYGINDSGVYALASESPALSTLPVAIEADVHTPDHTLKRAVAVRLFASGADVTLGLEITRIEPDGTPKEPLLKCGMTGKLRRNPRLTMASRPLRAIRWCLAGEVDSSFIFNNLDFTFNGY